MSLYQYRMVIEHAGEDQEHPWTRDKVALVEEIRTVLLNSSESRVRLERRSVTYGEPEVLDVV